MLKRITVIATLVAASSLGAQAFAATAQSGLYVSGLGGWSFAGEPSAPAGITAKNNNYTLGASIGYDHALNPNGMIGIEAGYVDFGKTTYSGTTGGSPLSDSFRSNGYQILATATYVGLNDWTAFAKAGAIDQTTTFDINNNSVGQIAYAGGGKDTRWIPATVLGVGHMLTPNLNLALQWEHTYGSDYNSNNTPSWPMNQDAISLGLKYKFAM